MMEFAREEIGGIQQQLVELEASLKLKLLPRDPLDDKNIMLEVRAGEWWRLLEVRAGEWWRCWRSGLVSGGGAGGQGAGRWVAARRLPALLRAGDVLALAARVAPWRRATMRCRS
jgi:hypothetical protein